MAKTYTQFVALVRDWSNRDTSALPDSIIQDSLNYAADKAYRKLRISALEKTVSYNSASLIAATTTGNGYADSKTEITVPSDLIEFIQIREKDASGITTRVFNEKQDVRSFNDPFSTRYDSLAYWTRSNNNVVSLSPAFSETGLGSPVKIEIIYYGRLADLDAVYNVTPTNYAIGLLTEKAQGDVETILGSTRQTAVALFFVTGSNTAYATLSEAQTADTQSAGTTTKYYWGKEAANWLRDQNERILLMGALAECYAYLQDDDQAAKYLALYQQEIDELNNEDKRRNSSGGNVQINYTGSGLI
jgi:hypothetical protein